MFTSCRGTGRDPSGVRGRKESESCMKGIVGLSSLSNTRQNNKNKKRKEIESRASRRLSLGDTRNNLLCQTFQS